VGPQIADVVAVKSSPLNGSNVSPVEIVTSVCSQSAAPVVMMVPVSPSSSQVDIIGPATAFTMPTVMGTSVSSVSSVSIGSGETLSSILHGEYPIVMSLGIYLAPSDRSSKSDSSSNCPMRMIPKASYMSISVCR